MKVVEIFKSIEGEGTRAGLPCIFIRLFGCNLNCSYCDTRYGCEGDGYPVMSVEEIMARVGLYAGVGNLKRVTLTGGEPMMHPGVDKLIQELLENGYDINVETNGTLFPKRFPAKTRERFNPVLMKVETEVLNKNYGTLFYTMDWKCKSSGMESRMDINIVNELNENDVLKFVVGSQEDLDGALTVIERMTSKPSVFFSPVFGQIEPSEIVRYVLDKGLNDCSVQVQLHKVIWNPDQKGV